MRNTNKDWSIIAESEPFFGVLADERFLERNLTPENRAAFFASGEIEIAHICRVFSDMGAGSPRTGLDFGCGVARMLIPMCARLGHAYGVDVSEAMLLLADKHLKGAGLTNFELMTLVPEVQVDWVNSWIVLQHIPPLRGYEVIRRLWAALKVGGWFSIQLTIYRDSRHMEEPVRDAVKCGYDGCSIEVYEEAANVNPGSMTMYDYNLSRVFAMLDLKDGQRFVAEHIDHNGCHSVRLYIKK